MTTPYPIDALIEAQHSRIRELEQQMWAGEPDDIALSQYHSAFQQLEQLIASKGDDQRHEFVIVIPVADRPQHLQACLDSLLHLCKTFGYGGYADGRYSKVSAIIADDSREPDNIGTNKAIAEQCNRLGLSTLYFGLDEQLDQMEILTDGEKQSLSGIIGTINEETFYHKGPSIMRNITYLELHKIKSDKALFYFIDSDQEFQLKISTAAGDKNLYACNYFYYLDQIFSNTDANMLTGKVVGDPPVSPAVMTGNFIADTISFLQQLSTLNPALACQFHSTKQQINNDASYHDMAALFGFKPNLTSHDYSCNIKGEHSNTHCLEYFAGELNHFFYGEHPTRKTYYQHEDVLAGIKPARTVYTGNYIFKPDMLKYFIPFAPLKLRMAGPVLGRLIKAEIGQKFVSANLPMLHKRTVQETGQAEFRPGVSADTTAIDLSGEFERQFYGDVMLFSIEKLCAQGYPAHIPEQEVIAAVVAEMHQSMLQHYSEKRLTIMSSLIALKALLNNPEHWWNKSAKHSIAIGHFQHFIRNIEHNFSDSSASFKLINSDESRIKRHAEMITGLGSVASDRLAWSAILANHTV